MALFISMFFLCGIRIFFRNSFSYREQDDRNLTCIRRFCILFDIPLPDRKRSSAIIGNHEIFQSEQPGTFAFCRARLDHGGSQCPAGRYRGMEKWRVVVAFRCGCCGCRLSAILPVCFKNALFQTREPDREQGRTELSVLLFRYQRMDRDGSDDCVRSGSPLLRTVFRFVRFGFLYRLVFRPDRNRNPVPVSLEKVSPPLKEPPCRSSRGTAASRYLFCMVRICAGASFSCFLYNCIL